MRGSRRRLLSLHGLCLLALCVAGSQVAAAKEGPVPSRTAEVACDRYGDPLPAGAIARLGTVRFRLQGWTNLLAFCAQDQRLVSASDDSIISLWETATGRELRCFAVQQRTLPWSVAVSRDGKILAAGWAGHVDLWEVPSGQKLGEVRTGQGNVGPLAFASDGKALAVADHAAPGVRVSAIPMGRELHRVTWPDCPAQALAFSPDGQTLAIGRQDGTVLLWRLATGKQEALPGLHPHAITSLAFAPDGRALALGGRSPVVRLWDITTGRETRAFRGHYRSTHQVVAFSPDGRLLAAGGLDVRLWEVASGRERGGFRADDQGVRSLAFSSDGKVLAAGTHDNTIYLLDGATCRPRHGYEGHRDAVSCVRFTPDGQTALTGSSDGTIRFWEAGTGRELRRIDGRPQGLLPALLGEWLDRLEAAVYPDCGHDLGLFALLDGGRRLASVSWRGTIRLWDARTGRELERFGGSPNPILGAAFSADGSQLVLWQRGIQLWSVQARKRLASYPGLGWIIMPGGVVVCSAFAPDGRTVASAVDREPVRIWEVATGITQREFGIWGESASNLVALSPDGALLAYNVRPSTAIPPALYVAEVATGRGLLELPEKAARALAFSPDSRSLAVGTESGAVRVWEMATGGLRRVFQGHHGPVASLAFSPEGTRLLSGGCDTTAVVWDLTGLRKGAGLPTLVLSEQELQAAWADLASADALRAERARWRLVAAPRQAVSFLEKHVAPVPRVEPARLAQLIGALDADQFAVREQASRELERLGEVSHAALRQALDGHPAPEVRHRLRRILQNQEKAAAPRETVRQTRALEVLELVGSVQARRFLGHLAAGAPQARLTQQASASFQRLARRANPAR